MTPRCTSAVSAFLFAEFQMREASPHPAPLLSVRELGSSGVWRLEGCSCSDQAWGACPAPGHRAHLFPDQVSKWDRGQQVLLAVPRCGVSWLAAPQPGHEGLA